MPRKPKFIHPVRQVRTSIGRTQAAFARLVGCSTVTVQRVENGSLKLSEKLANAIMEATGADPASLQSGPSGKALDMRGEEYSKSSFEFYRKVMPGGEREFQHFALILSHQIQLMLMASNRTNVMKMRAVYAALQNSFLKLASDFALTDGINRHLIAAGSVDKRKYRVSDLRKFPDFARIIGYKDDKRFRPDKLIPYDRPKGWMSEYFLHEVPILPPDSEMKLRPDADYILVDDRPIPQALQDIIDQALYWEIKEFRRSFVDPPQRG